MSNDEEIEKVYFTVKEVASLFQVSPSVIRFWENEFAFIRPRITRKGSRQYTQEDVNNVKTVYHLLKEKGFTLQGAKDYLKQQGNQKNLEKIDVIHALKNVRALLVELKDQLEKG